MLLGFLVVASALPAAAPVAATARASANVRIVRAAEIRRDRLKATEGSVKRRAIVRESDGTTRSATLIEFY
jgi:hypothetical protein